jgi:hypothetical protein
VRMSMTGADTSPCPRCGRQKRADSWCTCATPQEILASDNFTAIKNARSASFAHQPPQNQCAHNGSDGSRGIQCVTAHLCAYLKQAQWNQLIRMKSADFMRYSRVFAI